MCVCAAGLLSRSKTLQVSDSTRMSPHLRLPNSTHLYTCMMLLDTFLCHVVTLLFLLALIFLLTISQNHLLFFFFCLSTTTTSFFFFSSLCVCVCVFWTSTILAFRRCLWRRYLRCRRQQLHSRLFPLSLSLPPSSITIKSVILLALFGKKKNCLNKERSDLQISLSFFFFLSRSLFRIGNTYLLTTINQSNKRKEH